MTPATLIRSAVAAVGAMIARVRAAVPKIGEAIGVMRGWAANLTVFLAAVSVLYVAYERITRQNVVIKPITAPQSLVDEGFTEQILSNRLTDQMVRIRDTASVTTGTSRIAESWNEPDIVVPGLGLSLNGVISYAQDALGMPAITVDGEVIDIGDGWRLRLRTRGRGTTVLQAEGLKADGLDRLMLSGAMEVLRVTDPYLVAVHLLDGQPDQAIDLLRRAASEPPFDDDARALALWGYQLMTASVAPGGEPGWTGVETRHRQARDKFAAAVETAPDAVLVRLLAGLAEAQAGDVGRAVEHLKRASKMAPKDPMILAHLGEALYAQGAARTADRAFAEAVALKPLDSGLLVRWGNALTAAGRVDLAEAKYGAALELDPGDAVALRDWGRALSETGDPDGAAEKYRQAQVLDPGVFSPPTSPLASLKNDRPAKAGL